MYFIENTKTDIYINYYIGESDIHGQGIFNKEDIQFGTVIGTWITTDIAKAHRYLIKDEWYETYPLGRMANHSDNPNTKFSINDGNVNLISMGIEKGEEILVNYWWTYEISGFKSDILK